MPVVHPLGGGIDVHQAQLTAGRRRVDTAGQVTQEVRECATPDDAGLSVSTWLTEEQGAVVGLESTGVDGRPVSHVLVGTVAGLVGHAQERRRRPGHKSDTADARGMAALLAHGLIRPRVIPPPPLQALRELTRPRVAWIQARTPANPRVVKVLEETHSKRTSVVSALCGRRGRRRLAALGAGERAPKPLAALALGVWRRKQSPRARARTGPCTAHHAWRMPGALARIALLDRQLPALDPPIGELMAPWAPPLEQLTRSPGGAATAAPASGVQAAHAQGTATAAGCWGRVPGPPANPRPSSAPRVGVVRDAAGARQRRWPSLIKVG